MNIIDNDNKKKPWLAILIPIIVLAIAIPIAIFYFFNGNAANAIAEETTVAPTVITGDTEKYVRQSEIYSEQSIPYEYEDYLADEAATTESGMVSPVGISGPAKQLIMSNDEFLISIRDLTMIDTTSAEVAASICKQTTDMNAFINSYLGWDESKYGVDFTGVRTYINSLILSMQDVNLSPDNTYPEIPLEDQRSAVKYSIAKQEQYHLGNPSKLYKETLLNYMLIGHPEILTINTMVLSNADGKFFDGISSNLQAKIVTDSGTYFIYMVSQVPDGVVGEFKILDVIKLP